MTRVPATGPWILLVIPWCGLLAPSVSQPLAAQEAATVVRIQVDPPSIVLSAGEHVAIEARALDALGNEVEAEFRFSGPRGALSVAGGVVRALEAGEHEVVVSLFPSPGIRWEGDTPPTAVVPVRVGWPTLSEVHVEPAGAGRLYEGTTLQHRGVGVHDDGTERPREQLAFQWSTSDPSIASVDRFGNVTAHRPSSVVVTAEAEGVGGSVRHEIAPFPAERLELTGGADRARAGDVLRFEARAYGPDGREIQDLPVTWSHTFVPNDSVGPHAGGSGLVRDGRFVGELPGVYTVMAVAGRVSARHTVEVEPRGVIRPTRPLGQGRVNYKHSSDFWVFEGRDGRDYAITGTWGAAGWAYMWDVTDPTSIVKTDSVQVDARTVNDVKVSPDARYATMTREGASNRRNGLVILDLQDPAHPRIASTIDDGLTGGVHNAFPDTDYVYALSGGERYLIFDVRDIYSPRYMSTVEVPGARIHDVWVKDGMAYSAQRPVGGVIVDVGNGRWGGSPENPVIVNTTGAMPEGGGSHTVFPYHQVSTGRTLLFLADEILSREGRAWGAGLGRGLTANDPYDPATGTGGTPPRSSGYLHILDVTDPENPEVIARYQVPEFGTHNTWVEDDVLYQAYFEGGVRVVDVSGELMGDLHKQDREIAVYKSFDPDGYIKNAPFVWSAMPHKDYVFFSDINSGLWAVEVEGLRRPTIP